MAFTPHRRRTKITNHYRKVAYPTKLDARAAALRVRQEIGQAIVWYPCYIDGPSHWHIGHPEKRNWQQEMEELIATVANQEQRIAELERERRGNKPHLKVVGGKR